MIEKMGKSEVKRLIKVLEKYTDDNLNYNFFKQRNKVYITSKQFDKEAVIRLNSRGVGMLLGWFDEGNFIFTIEGAQLIGNNYDKVLNLTEEQLYYWMHGQNFEIKASNDYYLLKFNKDIIGWAKVRDGILMNSVEKDRVIFRL